MREIAVSIVCTNYNKGNWVAEAIESFMQQQTNFEFEVIVIDDCSTDNSPNIIREYAEKYPDKLRVIFNDKNLGITKTWIKVCKLAKGRYIARCDGDDYWIDDQKLQKQVDLLENNSDSEWCSTDYDIITPEGVVTHRSAFETGLVDRSSSYAQVLATKGFTMASTWLVDTALMLEINSELDSDAADDTFNIQLDLFNRTELTYLPEATTVYRVNEGSDSRPIEIEKIRARHERLLKTQLDYVNKYKNINYDKILEIVLRRDMTNEMLAIERLQIVYEQRARIHQLEETLLLITESKSYRFTLGAVKLLKSLSNFPKKVVRKLLWLDGRRRYRKYHTINFPSKDSLRRERDEAKSLSIQPLISIIVPAYNTDYPYLREMIKSVKGQTYAKWELVIVDDASPDSKLRELIKKESEADSRIRYKFLKKNLHIAGATNEGFKLARGDYVSLLDHDDLLHPSALFEVAAVVNDSPNAEFIYTDEDKISENGQHTDPFIKPDWNQELLYSVNYITHFVTIRRTIVNKVGGELGMYNGAQDWDLFLRCTRIIDPQNIIHIPKILYSWRAHDRSTAKSMQTKPYVFEAQRRLLEDNLRARGLKDNEFTVLKSRFMDGAWEVSYKSQDLASLHTPGEAVDYAKIKGLAMTKDQIHRYFGRVSLATLLYENCQYTVANDDSEVLGA